jgi:hypothetical protein
MKKTAIDCKLFCDTYHSPPGGMPMKCYEDEDLTRVPVVPEIHTAEQRRNAPVASAHSHDSDSSDTDSAVPQTSFTNHKKHKRHKTTPKHMPQLGMSAERPFRTATAAKQAGYKTGDTVWHVVSKKTRKRLR